MLLLFCGGVYMHQYTDKPQHAMYNSYKTPDAWSVLPSLDTLLEEDTWKTPMEGLASALPEELNTFNTLFLQASVNIAAKFGKSKAQQDPMRILDMYYEKYGTPALPSLEEISGALEQHGPHQQRLMAHTSGLESQLVPIAHQQSPDLQAVLSQLKHMAALQGIRLACIYLRNMLLANSVLDGLVAARKLSPMAYSHSDMHIPPQKYIFDELLPMYRPFSPAVKVQIVEDYAEGGTHLSLTFLLNDKNITVPLGTIEETTKAIQKQWPVELSRV